MSAPVLPAAEVERAREALRSAADELTSAVTHRIERDDGSRTTTVTPAPLELIARELTGSGRDGSFAPKSRPPVWLDALSLLEEIDHATGASPARRCEEVSSWAYARSSSDGAVAIDTAEQVTRWRNQVRELLDPSPRFQLRGQSCPRCGAVKVWQRVDRDNGEAYARPALGVDADRGVCVCSACGASWDYELWDHLVAVLEQQRAEVLAVGPGEQQRPDVAGAGDQAGVPLTRCDRR